MDGVTGFPGEGAQQREILRKDLSRAVSQTDLQQLDGVGCAHGVKIQVNRAAAKQVVGAEKIPDDGKHVDGVQRTANNVVPVLELHDPQNQRPAPEHQEGKIKQQKEPQHLAGFGKIRFDGKFRHSPSHHQAGYAVFDAYVEVVTGTQVGRQRQHQKQGGAPVPAPPVHQDVHGYSLSSGISSNLCQRPPVPAGC